MIFLIRTFMEVCHWYVIIDYCKMKLWLISVKINQLVLTKNLDVCYIQTTYLLKSPIVYKKKKKEKGLGYTMMIQLPSFELKAKKAI